MYYHGCIHDGRLNYLKASGVGMQPETPAFFYFMPSTHYSSLFLFLIIEINFFDLFIFQAEFGKNV